MGDIPGVRFKVSKPALHTLLMFAVNVHTGSTMKYYAMLTRHGAVCGKGLLDGAMNMQQCCCVMTRTSHIRTLLAYDNPLND